jgi:molecular chaperone DnaK (HSP70)
MRIGLDFGTTNSGAAVFDGQHVHLFPLDPASHDPAVVRSTLYITRDHQVFIGQETIDTYYRQNVGRPSKMVRQYVGEIEMTFADYGSVKGYPVGPTTLVRDVYVLRASEIDIVVRTGGSAQIPCFVEMLGCIFGSEKVVLSDVFSSVTAGLAIRARMNRCQYQARP